MSVTDLDAPRWRVGRIWALAFALAMVAALYFGFESWLVDMQASGGFVPPTRGTVAGGITWFVWALMAPAIVAFFRAFPVERRWHVRTAAIYIGAAFAAAFVHGAMDIPIWLWATNAPPVVNHGPVVRVIWWTLITGPSAAVQFLAFATVYHAIALARSAHARELATSQAHAALAQAELRALKVRLEPHFLFNTLNAIVSYVRHDPAVAEEMIGRLSRLLRAVLQSSGEVEVPLAQEVALVREYLELHRIRFGDRLTIDISIDQDVAGALIPSMLLQPIVENAIQHGVAARTGAGRVQIVAHRTETGVSVEVSDASTATADGLHSRVTFPMEPVLERGGMGLSITRARLTQLYGSAQRLTLLGAASGTTVRIDLPLRDVSATSS